MYRTNINKIYDNILKAKIIKIKQRTEVVKKWIGLVKMIKVGKYAETKYNVFCQYQ